MGSRSNIGQRTLNSIRRFGVTNTLRSISCLVEDVRFEWRYGLRSMGWVPLDKLDISPRDKTRSKAYKPTRLCYFRRLIARLELPANRVLVDFGCGKGRLLLAAMELGFQKAVGVELSRQLCDVAAENVRRFESRYGRPINVELVHSDAGAYTVRPEEDVFFFYNPFKRDVMEQVLGNIERSLATHPRPAWLLYVNPVHRALVEQRPLFTIRFSYRYGATFGVAYDHAPTNDAL